MQEGGERRLVCGLYMAKKKRPKFDEFVSDARARGLDVIDLDLDAGVPLAQKLDAILHKFTDDIAAAGKDPGAARRLENFEVLLASNPKAAVIDPVDGIRPLLNRAEMQRVLAVSVCILCVCFISLHEFECAFEYSNVHICQQKFVSVTDFASLWMHDAARAA
jgi:hypothetical protein